MQTPEVDFLGQLFNKGDKATQWKKCFPKEVLEQQDIHTQKKKKRKKKLDLYFPP